GCDALNTGFASLLGINAMGIKQSCTWEEYHTGVLYLSECSGPVEGLLSICAVFLVTAFKGGSVVLFNLLSSTQNVIAARRKKGLSIFPAFLGLIPLVLTLSLLTVWLSISPSIIGRYLVPFSIMATFLFGHLVGNIIVAHVSKRGFPYVSGPVVAVGLPGLLSAFVLSKWDKGIRVRMFESRGDGFVWKVLEIVKEGYLFFWGGVDNSFGKKSGGERKWNDGDVVRGVHAYLNAPAVDILEGVVVLALLLLAVTLYFWWVGIVVSELCDIFDIYCLRIKYFNKKNEGGKGAGGSDGKGKTEEVAVRRSARLRQAEEKKEEVDQDDDEEDEEEDERPVVRKRASKNSVAATGTGVETPQSPGRKGKASTKGGQSPRKR
ncbi:hypothetical protein HDU76_001476, partial [Blyttiomyces sp. JEL0837]